VDGLVQIQVDISLGHPMRSFKRRWNYPPFVPPPLFIFNQEEKKEYSGDIGIE
jgi:hypothetical protein